ncbi:MAG: hypothetical protein AAFY38_15655 [Pseudomonadota bacterium]
MTALPHRPDTHVFFSLRLADARSDMLTRNAGPLRCAMRAARRARPFEIDSIVILPAALHAIWELPPEDADFTARLGLFRAHFHALLAASNCAAEWQGRVSPRVLHGAEEIAAQRALIHQMPVQEGVAQRPEAWQFSSIHRARDPGRLSA